MSDKEIREAFEAAAPYKESTSVIQVTKRFEIFRAGYKAGMKSEALERAVELLQSWADNESPWQETYAFLKEQEK
jgi:hypothetical protein